MSKDRQPLAKLDGTITEAVDRASAQLSLMSALLRLEAEVSDQVVDHFRILLDARRTEKTRFDVESQRKAA